MLFTMMLVLVRPPSNISLFLYSIEWYRGHTKGFEFNILHYIGVGLVIGALIRKQKPIFLLPGVGIYCIHILASSLSIFGAYEPIYALMGTWKFGMVLFVGMGVCLTIQDEKDIRCILMACATALIINVLVCLKFRYVDGLFQVHGWFEHQNPMAMWSYSLGLPLLAVSLSKEISFKDSLFFLMGYGAAGLSIALSASRASTAIIGAGTIILLSASFLRGVTIRRVGVLFLITLAGSAVLYKVMDTIIERFETSESTDENSMRWVMIEQSKFMFNSSPAVGIGWNNFGIANSRPRGVECSKIIENWTAETKGYTVDPKRFYRNALTESHYWLILAETGYLGFVTFILFLLTTLYWCLRCIWYYRKSTLGFLCLGIGLTLFIMYLHGQLERILTQKKNVCSWMIFLGIMMRIELWRRQKRPPELWDDSQQTK